MSALSRRARIRLGAAAALILAVALPYFYYVMPFEPVGRPTLVGRERLSCGDIMLTQELTGRADLGSYVVSFYFRPPGGKEWAEYYLDHESMYWRGSIDVAADRASASLHSYGSPRGSFSCSDRRMSRPRGKSLGPKARFTDPLNPVPRRLHNSPADVGADPDNPFPGYRWQ